MRKITNEELGRPSAEEFARMEKMPVAVVLDNVRSMQNVGAFFRTADAFASLLRDCAAHYDGRERRPEQLLLYHVGRYLYLADALEDLPGDVRAGAYNPLRYRYGADGGTLDPADRAQLLETIDASISMACSAMELLDGRRDRELLSNILYFGLPAVLHAVAEGTFRKAGNRRKT